jgi:hypothetical protein
MSKLTEPSDTQFNTTTRIKTRWPLQEATPDGKTLTFKVPVSLAGMPVLNHEFAACFELSDDEIDKCTKIVLTALTVIS